MAEMDTHEWLDDAAVRAAYGTAMMRYDLAVAVVAARQRDKMTQGDLARRAGVSRAYIATLERGDANPTLGRLGAILAALGLTVHIHLVPLVVEVMNSLEIKD